MGCAHTVLCVFENTGTCTGKQLVCFYTSVGVSLLYGQVYSTVPVGTPEYMCMCTYAPVCKCMAVIKYMQTLAGGLPGGTSGKESACNAGGLGLIPGWGRSPGGGNSNPLQYSCLENPMDRGAWWATIHGATKSQT